MRFFNLEYGGEINDVPRELFNWADTRSSFVELFFQSDNTNQMAGFTVEVECRGENVTLEREVQNTYFSDWEKEFICTNPSHQIFYRRNKSGAR